MKLRFLAPALIVTMLTITSCSDWKQANGHGDAPVGPVDNNPAKVVNFNDTFGNVATKCDGFGFRIWVTTHGDDDDSNNYASQITVLPDPKCGVAK